MSVFSDAQIVRNFSRRPLTTGSTGSNARYAEPSRVEADPVTGQSGNRSVAFDMGVHFEQDCDDADPQKQQCTANAAGRKPIHI